MRRLAATAVIVATLVTIGFVEGSAGDQGITCRCTLKHSAVAGLDDDGQIDVHTTDNDAIPVSITGLGQDEAVFNKAYSLIRVNEDPEAIYYMQPLPGAMVTWVYFKRSHAITYAKLRAFPVTGQPSSYMMMAKCKR